MNFDILETEQHGKILLTSDIQKTKLPDYLRDGKTTKLNLNTSNIKTKDFKFYIKAVNNQGKVNILLHQLGDKDKERSILDFIKSKTEEFRLTKDLLSKKDNQQNPEQHCESKEKNVPVFVEQEAKSLSKCLNKLLEQFTLLKLKDEILEKHLMLYEFSTKGDKLINFDLQEMDLSKSLTVYYNGNSAMRYALVNLGVDLATNMNDHLAGTFFEAIYYIAHIQKRDDVKDMLLQNLTGKNYRKIDVSTMFCASNDFYKDDETKKENTSLNFKNKQKDIDKVLRHLRYKYNVNSKIVKEHLQTKISMNKLSTLNFDVVSKLRELELTLS